MDLSIMQTSLRSLQSSIAMAGLKRSMNQNASAVTTLLQDFQAANPPSPTAGQSGYYINTHA